MRQGRRLPGLPRLPVFVVVIIERAWRQGKVVYNMPMAARAQTSEEEQLG
jgi:hypothetical protein